MLRGILSGMDVDESCADPVLTTEDMQILNDFTSGTAVTSNIDTFEVLANTIELACEAMIIDKLAEEGTLTKEHYLDKLDSMLNKTSLLLGTESDEHKILGELYEAGSIRYELTVEERKKRRGVMDTILHKINDMLDLFSNTDAFKEIPANMKAIFSRNKPLVATLKRYKEQIKSGEITLKREAVSSSTLARKLGAYSLYSNKYSVASHTKFLKAYFKLINSNLLTSTIKDVHDSLVQSKDNEKVIPMHKDSIKFIESFKNLDTDEYVYHDTRFVIPSNMFGPHMLMFQVVQDPNSVDTDKPGIGLHTNTLTAMKDDYAGFRFAATKSELLGFIDLVLEQHKAFDGEKIAAINRRFTMDVIKHFRSALATGGYLVLFNIFGLRRMVRQVMLSRGYIENLSAAVNNVWIDNTKALLFAADLVKVLTKND